MKNWNTLEADVNVILNKHFTPGRAGAKIDRTIVHHNDGYLTTEGCWDVWQVREASAHYQVEQTGRIGQLVWDKDTAWSAGNLWVNQRAISIEHANSSRNPYAVSAATLEEGAHLLAAIHRFHNLGRPVWGVNVFGHNDIIPTGCPGSLGRGGSQHAQYMVRAQHWYDQMAGGAAASANPAAKYPNLPDTGGVYVDNPLVQRFKENLMSSTMTSPFILHKGDKSPTVYAAAPNGSWRAFKTEHEFAAFLENLGFNARRDGIDWSLVAVSSEDDVYEFHTFLDGLWANQHNI